MLDQFWPSKANWEAARLYSQEVSSPVWEATLPCRALPLRLCTNIETGDYLFITSIFFASRIANHSRGLVSTITFSATEFPWSNGQIGFPNSFPSKRDGFCLRSDREINAPSSRMKILALELSTARGSLVWLDGEIELACEWPNDRKNSAAFFENLDNVVKKFGAPQLVVVGLGPGSYASTRIVISAAIGLQVSSGARLIGYPSICAMDSDAQEYCVIGDARRKSFFFAQIRANELVEGPHLFSEEELKNKLATLGNDTHIFCCESLPQFPDAAIRYPSAVVLARLTQDPTRNFTLPPLEPMYLREPHITLPKAQEITL